VSAGMTLVDAALKAGVDIETPCGARGACGRCIVRVVSGNVDTDSAGKLSGEQLDAGFVLACRTRVADTDLTIEVPQAKDLEGGQFGDSLEGIRVLNPSLMPGPQDIAPPTGKVTMDVSAASGGDGLSDLDRFVMAMRDRTGATRVNCPLGVVQTLAESLRASSGKLTVTSAHSDTRHTVVAVEPGDTGRRQYGVAIDIGTTTIAALLVAFPEARIVAVHADYNGQVSCGLDVISRINYARHKRGLDELRKRVLETVNGLIGLAAQSGEIRARDITSAAVSGNTTMIHLLLGLNPDYIRLEPYTPTLLDVPVFSAGDVGLDMCPRAPVVISPAVGSYVGGDITAGVLCTDLAADAEDICLFMDIGTNGEIVVGNRDFLMTCACSAGPAFEGGGIGCGMRAAEGAIERVEIDPKTGVASVGVIGNAKPRGICGSGMISLLSGLFSACWLDQAGKLDRDRPSPAITVKGRRAAYTIVPAKKSGTGEDIVITELDIENIVRAKAAVYSACAMILNQIGIGFESLSKVYIAGGFGRYIDLDGAVAIGLLPDIERSKFHFIGNSSLAGTYMLLVSERHRRAQRELARRMTYIELNTDPGYMDHYTAALFLPHTDPGLFPSVHMGR